MNASAIEDRHYVDLLDFNALFRRLWRDRWWIVGASVAVGVLAGVVAFRMTPIYRATVVLVPASAEQAGLGALGDSMGSLGGLAALAGVNLGGTDSATQEALAVLRSRQFADAFVNDRGLGPLFFHTKWDAQQRQWKVPKQEQPTQADAFKYFDRRVRFIVEDKKRNIILLQVDWRDRQLAAGWANELVARLNAEMRRRAIAHAEASMGFLKQELENTNMVDTREAINRLMENQINRRMMANVTAEYAFRVVDPAVAPDEGDFIKPRKLVMVFIGTFLGFLAAVSVVAMFRR